MLWVVEGTGPGRHTGQDPGNQGPGARTHWGSYTHTHLHTAMFFTLFTIRCRVSHSTYTHGSCSTYSVFLIHQFTCSLLFSVSWLFLALITQSLFCFSFSLYCHVPHSIIPVVFDPITLLHSCIYLTPSLTHPDTTPHRSLSQQIQSPKCEGCKRDTPGFQYVSP